MLYIVLLLYIHSLKSTVSIPFDGTIHRNADGSSYAFLSPPRTGNHASFIEEITPAGNLAIAWFTGGEATPNCSIAVSILKHGSERFTPGVIVSERVNYANQNPVLHWDSQTQVLHLHHTSQLGNASETDSELWHAQSHDQGETWSTDAPFYTLPGSFDRNRIIATKNNDVVIYPCYNTSTNAGYSFTLRSSSTTSNWSRVDFPMSDNLVQPSIVRLNHSLQLRTFFRDRRAESIYYADSHDDGLTWTTPKPTTLPSNNAGIEAYVLQSGAVIIAFNNHNSTKQPRTPLTVALSYDNGMTWPYHRDVQLHDDDSENVGEYSYPSILQTNWKGSDDNDIHLVYTYDRLTIKYMRFSEEWVRHEDN